jgi:hypothetical protein
VLEGQYLGVVPGLLNNLGKVILSNRVGVVFYLYTPGVEMNGGISNALCAGATLRAGREWIRVKT